MKQPDFFGYYVRAIDKPSWCQIGWHRWRFKKEQGFSDRLYRCERCGDSRVVKPVRAKEKSHWVGLR